MSSLAFSTDGQLLASGSFDGIIQIWDIALGNLKGTLEGPSGGIEVRFSIFVICYCKCTLYI